MVELLLAYVPSSLTKESDCGLENFQRIMQFKLQWGNFFRPDMAGPAGLTPLHIAASMQDAEDVVDALTSDPCQVCLQFSPKLGLNLVASPHTLMSCICRSTKYLLQ
jgi:hypothetical protein